MPIAEKLGPGWARALKSELSKPYVASILTRLASESVVPRGGIFKPFRVTDLDTVKVAIVGSEPYPDPNQATGLPFATPEHCFPKPATLTNILREVERNIGRFVDHSRSTLDGWAKQGVLLLNTIATTSPGKPGAHSGWGWDVLTEAALFQLALLDRPLVVMLWGSLAAQYEWMFDRHCVLKAAHPHPATANRGGYGDRFVGCRHFAKANEYLAERGEKPINWAETW